MLQIIAVGFILLTLSSCGPSLDGGVAITKLPDGSTEGLVLMCHDKGFGATLYEVAKTSSESDTVVTRWEMEDAKEGLAGHFGLTTPDWFLQPERKVRLANEQEYTLIGGGHDPAISTLPLNFALSDLKTLRSGDLLYAGGNDSERNVTGTLAEFRQVSCGE